MYFEFDCYSCITKGQNPARLNCFTFGLSLTSGSLEVGVSFMYGSTAV